MFICKNKLEKETKRTLKKQIKIEGKVTNDIIKKYHRSLLSH